MAAVPDIPRNARALFLALLVAGYPVLIFTGLAKLSPRVIGVVILAGILVASRWQAGRLSALIVRRFGLMIAVAALAAASNHPAALTLLPAVTNAWLLATFLASLRKGPPIVEQVARSLHDEFPDFLVPYCRKVTWVWCGFFAVNGIVAAALAIGGTIGAWAAYTGGISYLLIGVLAATEYVVRKTRFRFYEGGAVDSLWRRAFPPQHTALGRRTLEWQLARTGRQRPDR